ncbi:glycosyltransferase [uncultured Cohaesibacter sp.]|uniref:glycosyltransferase n=1 Tax=uncultured Cohaesibacter sp. TaxID=1002546 RepID=UPI0029C75711|nr:glycosyltransferase [uncultured Cohaesibacter sp.]
MNNKLISIIVTSYNVEKYIEQSLGSIISQTLKPEDVEIIVVDDGSTDSSPDLIAKLAEKHSNVIPVLLKENSVGGVATAANAGLEKATGKYIGFADGDDVYKPTMFEKLVNAAESHDSDLAFCNYLLLDDSTGGTSTPADDRRWADLQGLSMIELDEVRTKQILRFVAVPWRKIYRRDLLVKNNIRFPVGDYFFEDNPFHWFSVLKARNIAIVPEKLCYHRIDRAGQTMQSADARLFKMFEHHLTIHQWLEKEQLLDTYSGSLLLWLNSQLSWIEERCPDELYGELFDAVSPHFRMYSQAQIRESINYNRSNYRKSMLAILLRDNNKERFVSVATGNAKFNVFYMLYYRVRRRGVLRILKDLLLFIERSVKGAANYVYKHYLSRLKWKGSSAQNELLLNKINDLSVGISMLERRLNDLSQSQKDALEEAYTRPRDLFAFNTDVRLLLMEGKVEQARKLIDRTIVEFGVSDSNYRIKFARNVLVLVFMHLERDIKALTGKEGVDIVKLKPLVIPRDLEKVYEFEDLADGKYIEQYRDNATRNPDDFKYFPNVVPMREQLLLSGLFRQHGEIYFDRLIALSDVRFSCASMEAATFVATRGDDNVYIPDSSGRIAKCSSVNAVVSDCDVLDEGYILPFPHSGNNFYHSFYEMGYGLRHLEKFDKSMRIYHGMDKFGVIPFFSKLFDIDIDRFVDVSKTPVRLKLGYAPATAPFYYSAHAFDFFRSNYAERMDTNASTPEKFYISRKNSERALIDESYIEDKLAELGFSIVYAEEISVDRQAELFFNAKTIVSPHGAGWTNMLFCEADTKFVEIFEEDMLSPDFCLRSKFITRDYTAVVQKRTDRVEDTVDNILRALEN